MSDTRNECRIVNELSEIIEAELSEAVEELEAEIVEKATIDDSEAGLTTTYSSEKIEDLIDSIPGGVEIDDTVTSDTKTWSSNKINTEVEAVETVANSKATIDDSEASQATTYSSNKIEDLIDNIPTGAEIDDSTESLDKTWSSTKIKTEIESGGSGFEPKYSFAKDFRGLSTSYTEKINTLTDFPDVTIEADKLYLVCFGIFNNGTEIVDLMNTNFKLEILTNGYEQRTIEVNQPTGRYQNIFGTSIQPFILPINSGATSVGFKLYGNNSGGEKSNLFNFVMKIYELGDLTN